MEKSATAIKFLVIIIHIIGFQTVSASDTVLVDFISLPFHIKTLASDSSGTIWISGGMGLYYFEGKEFVQKYQGYSGHIINKNGSIIEIEEYGDSLFRNGYFPWYLFEFWQKYLPDKNPYISAGKDKDGKYWVGSGNNIFIFKIEDRFTQMFSEFSFRGLYQDEDENLYLNTYQGIYVNDEPLWEFPSYAQGNITKIEDELWFAWAGILKYNPQSQQKESIRIKNMHPNGELSGMYAFKVTKLNDTIWVATSMGLGFVKFDSLYFISDSIHIEDIYYEAKGDRYIIATYGKGLLERKGKQITPLNLPLFKYNQILFHSGTYYLATDKGLLIWDGSAQYKLIDQDDGLSSSMIYAILVDDFNNLWVSTDVGLNRINLQTGAINQYLKNIEFNKRSFLKNGEDLYFGSIKGLYRFQPGDFLGDDERKPQSARHLWWYLLIFLITFLSISVYWRRRNKVQQKKKEAQLYELEKQLFLSKVEGFIFKGGNQITVYHIAAYLEVSERQLYRIFEQYEITPGKFIKDIKLRKAHYLIENKKMDCLKKVAEEVGYSESYFRKLYKEKYGNDAVLPSK